MSEAGEILEILRSIELPLERRRSVRASEKHQKRGFVLGYTICYSQGWTCSTATRKHPLLAFLLCQYIRRRLPNFVFTSIMVNQGRSALHVDMSNCDLSAIFSLGDHTGGELWQYPNTVLRIHGKLRQCHGSLPHITLPFEGERYSFVYYNLAAKVAKEPSPETTAVLDALGFWRPDDRPTRTLPARQDLLADAARILRKEYGLSSKFIGDYANKTIPSETEKRRQTRKASGHR